MPTAARSSTTGGRTGSHRLERPRSTAGASLRKRLRWLGERLPWLVLLVFVALGTFSIDVPVLTPLLALAAAVVVPTAVLYRRSDLAADTSCTRFLYALGLTVLGLMLVGLVVNTALPVVGVDRPLQPLVLVPVIGICDAALLVWRADVGPVTDGWGRSLRSVVSARVEGAQLLGAFSVLVAVLGAVRLNNGAGGAVAILGHLLAAAALVVLMTTRGSLGRDARVIAMVGLSLLLATSLRGWGIVGHDIQAEDYVYLLTNGAQRWQVSTFRNAYNACLSITILPAVLTQISGVTGPVLFKVVFQVLFASVPVATFVFSRRLVSRRLALVATSFTLAFPTFYTDMPYLVRQEVAYLFLALMLLAATEPRRKPRSLVLVVVLGVAVVLSHYSTTYVLLLGLGLGLAFWLAAALWQRRFGSRHRPVPRRARGLMLLSPVLIGILAATSLLWTGPATGTGAQVVTVVRSTLERVLGDNTSAQGASVLSYSLFSGGGTSPRDRLDQYVASTLKQPQRDDALVTKPGRSVLRPEILTSGEVRATGLGTLMGRVGLAPKGLVSSLRLLCAGLLQVLLFVGLLRLLRGRRRWGYRLPTEYAAASWGTVAALGVIVVIPSLSVEYGVLRAFQQVLLLVAPVVALGLELPARLLRRLATPVLVATPVFILLVLAGVIPTLFGAYSPPLALRNAGTYYDRYYLSPADTALVQWVSSRNPRESPASVTARSAIGVKILAATRLQAKSTDGLYPTLLVRGSFIVADGALRRSRADTLSIGGNLVEYRYPLQVLSPLSIVYSAGQGRVYR